jgi:hypothetical protein
LGSSNYPPIALVLYWNWTGPVRSVVDRSGPEWTDAAPFGSVRYGRDLTKVPVRLVSVRTGPKRIRSIRTGPVLVGSVRFGPLLVGPVRFGTVQSRIFGCSGVQPRDSAFYFAIVICLVNVSVENLNMIEMSLTLSHSLIYLHRAKNILVSIIMSSNLSKHDERTSVCDGAKVRVWIKL